MTPMRLAALLALLVSCSGCFAPNYVPVDEKLYEVPIVNGYAFYYDVGVLLEGPWLLLLAFFMASCDVDWDKGKETIKTVAAPFALVVSLVGGTVAIPVTAFFWAVGATTKTSRSEPITKPPAALDPGGRAPPAR